MKKILLIALFMPLVSQAQSLIGGKNIVKWNVSSMAFRNLNFTYERSITKNISLSVSYRSMSKGDLPFKDLIRDQINSNEINFDKFQMGNTAITPEVRFYFGLKRMKGFYIAPYARFASFDVTVPVKYSSNATIPPTTKEAMMDGKIKSTSVGVLLGYQFHIATKVVLDFQIVGGHYGTSKGDLNFAMPLNSYEQQALRDNLNSIDAKPFKFTNTVDANGARITSDGPWAGIRGLNLGLGIRF